MDEIDKLADEALEDAEKPVPTNPIFDELRELLDKAQTLIFQAQAVVFDGKNSFQGKHSKENTCR